MWTLLAPAALVIGAFFMFQAVFDSSFFSEGGGDEAAEDAGEEITAEQAAAVRTKVQEGQTLSAIATEFGYSIDELKACNPELDSQTLQAGQWVLVKRDVCEGADKAPVGADPDPLSGETAVSDAADADG